MSMRSTAVLAAAAALALAACIVPPGMYGRDVWVPPPEYWQEQGRYRREGDPAAADPAGTAASPGDPARAPAPPPQPWDDGVVDGAPLGRVVPDAGPPRGPEGPAGRTHIIELYQAVVEERDALAAKLDQLEKSAKATEAALQSKHAEADELGARVAALESARTSLVEENRALAARLVQAQIRRLEAEKLLLETRIETERARAAETLRAAAARPAKRGPAPEAEGEQP